MYLRNLQNLLLLTVIKTEPLRVLETIDKLEGSATYDGADIANIAICQELYEEAVVLHSKCGNKVAAIQVNLQHSFYCGIMR